MDGWTNTCLCGLPAGIRSARRLAVRRGSWKRPAQTYFSVRVSLVWLAAGLAAGLAAAREPSLHAVVPRGPYKDLLVCHRVPDTSRIERYTGAYAWHACTSLSLLRSHRLHHRVIYQSLRASRDSRVRPATCLPKQPVLGKGCRAVRRCEWRLKPCRGEGESSRQASCQHSTGWQRLHSRVGLLLFSFCPAARPGSSQLDAAPSGGSCFWRCFENSAQISHQWSVGRSSAGSS